MLLRHALDRNISHLNQTDIQVSMCYPFQLTEQTTCRTSFSNNMPNGDGKFLKQVFERAKQSRDDFVEKNSF